MFEKIHFAFVFEFFWIRLLELHFELEFVIFRRPGVVTTISDADGSAGGAGAYLSDLDSSLLLNNGPIDQNSLSRRPQKVFHK